MIDDLRLHAGAEGRPNGAGEFVLYWMQGVAMRSRWNLALNFAVQQANALNQPVVVYQGLRQDYPWASDRFHTFILESAVDLEIGLAARGIQYAFYLETDRDRHARASSPLVDLGQRASLVVTEYFPTFIQPRQLKRLREKLSVPVIAIDTSTVVPLRSLDRAYLSARSIRPVLAAALPHHLFPIADEEPAVHRPVEIPFDRVLDEDISTLLSQCAIDHRVLASPTIRGGERAARETLNRFLEEGLPRYDQRNDPGVSATSRLSPHLHFGTISIQEVLLAAREAGPADQFAKFLDEAFTWRELAFNLCFHNSRHRTLAAVPQWARRELADHEADPRPALYPRETLEQGLTDSALWNAAQRSLLRDGELHNYVRMLWGKSVLLWTKSASEALRVLEHLNHKYALDGRDPNSYAGILWCLGAFDRPFYRRPIFGTVRYMSLRAAKKKFDVASYVAPYPAIAAD